ncbi:hypothetical protein CYLTODRAFT_419837 [Cylindrobasidium torrendii FP15055 ss-10]|uniref:Uncharacterized protein n=1 Tax=Cylindrobasidium torrendii FP15055 ss-10 TaxID=1314674 RepID=A0A0D7BJF5_9AGAR|nr:hypothetical protein CYLTODRAFT_419837 [Cylindrobasidium torrendii FP15055 ss-10]
MQLIKSLVLLALPLFVTASAAIPRISERLPQYAAEKRHQQIREMKVRAEYPDLFPRSVDKRSSDPSPCRRRRRRGDEDIIEQVLTPHEMALFLIGEGSFTTDNGTVYIDEHWSGQQDDGRSGVGEFLRNSHVFNKIVNSVGDLLVQVTLPRYVQWKNSQSAEKLFHFTPKTALRFGDIDELVERLLAHPQMEEFQYGSMHFNRRWLEAAKAISGASK